VGDLETLLQGLNLGQYAEVFARQEVDFEAARLLADADFAALGIPLGPRRKIQAALANRTSGSGPRIEDFAPSSASSAVPAQSAERRQLTVLFCDLVGSTALSAAVDAEVLRADGSVVAGLYAVGLDANSMMRGTYPGGGSSIGPAMVFGYRAALHLSSLP
jgi:hypothetical protein